MASSIVTSASQQLGVLVINEAKYLYEVSDKIEGLQEDLRWMLCFLEDADNRQNREKVVAMWVSNITEFTYEAEDIIENYVHKVSNPRKNGGWETIVKWWLCALNDARALHEVGSSIDALTSKIEKLIKRLQLYGVKVTKDDATTRSTFVRKTYSHVEEDPIGLEEHTRHLVEQLVTNEQVKVVGICGMGGLGKTTLAKQVIKDISVTELFNGGIAWVCISKQFETKQVFTEILKSLDDTNKSTEGQLPGEISRVLSTRKCVVVLDDLWECHDWDALEPAFDSIINNSGSKLLITTRNQGLTEHIDPSGYSHNPNLLSDDDSWNLLRRIAFAQTENPDGDMEAKEELGREMLRHCEGLPLAILTLGGVLCNKKTLVEWQNVQKNIKSSLKGLFVVLELSYNDLPYYLKPCFMYLGHFPEDYEIRVDTLYHLWEAEGLVTNSEDDDDVEDLCLDEIAESYLNELVQRCLVQVGEKWSNGRIKTCRLHDVVRLMCLKKCKEVNFLKTISTEYSSSRTKIANSSSVNMKLYRCAFHLGDTGDGSLPAFESSANGSPCIRSLLVFQDKRSVWKFLTPNMKESLLLLRVLDLEGANISIHGKGVKDLIHLRYLSFNGATLAGSELPDFWDCKYLETLDLRCEGEVGLSNKFWKLQRLRHLYLPLEFNFGGVKEIVSLTDNQLEQLETLGKFSRESFGFERLWKMKSIRVFEFSNLNGPISRVELGHYVKLPMIATKRQPAYPLVLPIVADVINGDTSLLDTFVSHACIDDLFIEGRIEDVSRLERFDKRYLTKLVFRWTEIGRQGISIIEKLPELTILYLLDGSFADKKMSFSSGGFPKLYLLYLHNIDLEEWEICEGAIPNFRKLIIMGCEALKMIPSNLPTTVLVRCQPIISGAERYNTH